MRVPTRIYLGCEEEGDLYTLFLMTMEELDLEQLLEMVEAVPDGPRDWRRMDKGIADLRRRAEISQAAQERYRDALSSLRSDR